VKLPKEIEDALRDPTTRVHTVELTPEVKVRLEKINLELVDWLTAHTKGPAEAYIVLDFTMQALRDSMGLRAAGQFDSDDES
jgi:hypothetical protein